MKTIIQNGTITNPACKALAILIVATVSQYSGLAVGGSLEQPFSGNSQDTRESAGKDVASLAPTSVPAAVSAQWRKQKKSSVAEGTFMQQVHAQSDGLEVLLSDFRLAQISSAVDSHNTSSSKVDGLGSAVENHFMNEVRKAIERHPSVYSGALSERQAVQGVDVAKSYLYPQVVGGLEGGYTLLSRPGATSDKGFKPTAVLTVTQLLFDAGETRDRISSAQGLAKAERYNSMTKAQDFALRAVSTYMDVTRLETQLLLAQDNVTRHELLLDRVRQRTDGGVGNQADLLRARGRLEGARAQSIGATGDFEQILASYQELFGVQPTHVALPTVHPSFDNAPNELVSQALENNFSINRAQSQSLAAKFESDAEQDGRFPKVSFEMEGRQYEANRISNRDHEVTALLNIKYPFFTGGRLQAQRQRATLKFAQAKADERALRLEVERQVRFAITDIYTRTGKMASLELAVEADRQTFDNYLELFTVGRRTLIDLLDAQRDLFANSVALVNSRVQLDLSRFILSQMTGSLLEFFNVEEIPDHE
jgi:adhesin transport system outer membrane protein